MAILLSGCTGSSYGLFRTTGTGNALVNTDTPTPLKGDNDRGVCLSISPRSSLDIDVDCILDYVQGESTFGPENKRRDFLNPWICWNFSF
ncbi:MAG: hypothetical protein HGJ94_02325 [Desulfosarcina sp.]|nr:hypothetical protein [Desulfosarcina sp.]MBC2742492.1 hypothetical protein [Desulfosarcina sp.]MBC2765402.1 hypothetical protein [Desulfosarcina sp.]